MCTSIAGAWSIFMITCLISLIGVAILGDIVNLILILTLVLTTIVTLCYLSCCHQITAESVLRPSTTINDVDIDCEQTSNLVNRVVQTSTYDEKYNRRMPFLDNIKSVLTAIVVTHHTTACFHGSGGFGLYVGAYRNPFSSVFSTFIMILNQGYFMCFFFFISGYFSPISKDRKGIPAYMKDKLIRLGLPWLAYLFIFGPLLDYWTFVIKYGNGTDNNHWNYLPNAGQTWFLGWLIIFNFAYCVFGSPNAAMSTSAVVGAVNGRMNKFEIPSIVWMIGVGFALGLLQGVLLLFVSSFIMMPLTFGSLPFDVLFFTIGVLAKRNNWLYVNDTDNNATAIAATILPKGEVTIAHCVTVAVSLIVLVAFICIYQTNTNYFGYFIPLNSCTHGLDSVGFTTGPQVSVSLLAFLIGISALLGVFCVTCSISFLSIFLEYFNYESDTTKFYSSTAYTVYLIHSYVVNACMYAFIRVYEMVEPSVHFYWLKDNGGASTNCLGSDAALWLGWLITNIIVQLICWPLASTLRRAPLLRDVL